MDFNALLANWKDIVTNKYMCFDGRASRTQFWSFVIPNMIIGWIPFVGWLFMLAMLLPTIAAGARRLHDQGKTGWLMLLGLIPCINLALIVLLILPGNTESNSYGEVPQA